MCLYANHIISVRNAGQVPHMSRTKSLVKYVYPGKVMDLRIDLF